MVMLDTFRKEQEGMEMITKPIQLNCLTIKNRLVMPPMATAKSAPGGLVNQELRDYYRERALYSRVGLIITEHSYINIQGKAGEHQLSMASDNVVETMRTLTDTIHKTDVKLMAQINHAGSRAASDNTGCEPVGPSGILHPNGGKNAPEMPRELTREEIRRITEDFAQAARRAKEAGFDGVEIHSAHGYLLNQFYSPLTNKRSDEYGADTMENRTRFHVEVIRAVRAMVGPDYPVAIRLGGCDYREGGSTVEDCAEACGIFEKEGVDLLDITGGLFGYTRPGHTEPGYFKEMSGAVKKAVKIPVLVTGGVKTMEAAEELLREGFADMVGVGRAIFQDPGWADVRSSGIEF